MIAFTRVDNRLIHGQVIEGWLPQLDVSHIVVADDQAAADPLTRLAMGLAVPDRARAEILPVDAVDFVALEAASGRSLLLLRDVQAVLRARQRGLRCPTLNLGNIHFAPGRIQITPSVFLSPEEVGQLRALATEGVVIEVRALPRDKPLGLPELCARAGLPAPCGS